MEKKNYTNGEVTIVWQPKTCIHSAKCWRGENSLPEVFDPNKKPWINAEGASSERIIQQVKNCPSGAISYFMNNEKEENQSISSETVAETIINGPLLVYGNITVKDSSGNQTKKNKVTAFCRCGASSNKPYCDGSHVKIDFKG